MPPSVLVASAAQGQTFIFPGPSLLSLQTYFQAMTLGQFGWARHPNMCTGLGWGSETWSFGLDSGDLDNAFTAPYPYPHWPWHLGYIFNSLGKNDHQLSTLGIIGPISVSCPETLQPLPSRLRGGWRGGDGSLVGGHGSDPGLPFPVVPLWVLWAALEGWE